MSLKEDIMSRLNSFPGLTDTELEKHLNRSHQHINSACRELQQQGFLRRQPNPQKKGSLGNYPTGIKYPNIPVHTQKQPVGINEDTVKETVKEWLERNGWTVEIAWGKSHGVDIKARKCNENWYIEAKGSGSSNPMRVNYFLNILGETLQRMDDPSAKYSIALPNMQQYRNLWTRLPSLAKQRTKINMILVSKNGNIEILE